MNKLKQIFWVVAGVCLIYAVIAVFIVFFADITVSVNADLAAAHNMSLYPGLSGFILSSPWILYFVPGVIGIGLIVWILKRKASDV